MTAYVLCKGVTAAQTLIVPDQTQPPGSNLPSGSQPANPGGGAGTNTAPPTAQTFHFIITGTGAVGATYQVLVSNDGINWEAYGSTVVVASAQSPNRATATGNSNWNFFSCIVLAISGTGAKASCIMNA